MDDRAFFLHIMKTGGATFRRRIEQNVGARHMYPDPAIDEDMLLANMSVPYLCGLPDARVRSIKAYAGHFPFVVTQLLPGPFVTLTVVREPVQRTISFLKHCRRYQERHRGLPLEEIYEDPTVFASLIKDHQAKIFSFTPEDGVGSIRRKVDVDEERLRRACANLETVDVLGLHEHYDDFVASAIARLGWSGGTPPNVHVSKPKEISRSFRRRIFDDMAADVAFYEHAVSVYHARR